MSGLTVFLADRGIATLFQEMLHYIISPGGPSGAKKENKNITKIVKHCSPLWPPFSFFMGPVDLSVWNPGQNTVFLVIVMVVLSQFLHKTRFLDTWIVSEILSSLPFLGADGGGVEVGFVEGQGRFIITIT